MNLLQNFFISLQQISMEKENISMNSFEDRELSNTANGTLKKRSLKLEVEKTKNFQESFFLNLNELELY